MKKLIIALVAAVALTGAVYGAAASLTVGGVDPLGSNTATVDSTDSTFVITDVTWGIDANDITKVDSVTVEVSEAAGNVASGGATCSVGLLVDTQNVVGSAAIVDNNNAAVDSASTASLSLSPSVAAGPLVSITATLTCS